MILVQARHYAGDIRYVFFSRFTTDAVIIYARVMLRRYAAQAVRAERRHIYVDADSRDCRCVSAVPLRLIRLYAITMRAFSAKD